jgi:hypothetical protein
MKKFLVVTFVASLALTVGCSHSDKHADQQGAMGANHGSTSMHGDTMNASADACPHCQGVQTATADGKCPVCGMQVVNK